MIPGFIREQPQVLNRCVAAARAFATAWTPPAATGEGIVLVGSGSSLNALAAARPRFVASRRGPVLVSEPEDFVAELLHRTTAPLVVVLSQSGASTTSIAAARGAVAAGLPTLAVTASAGAPLAGAGAPVLTMPIGEEPVGPKTKGFTGSLATLFVLAEALGCPPGAVPTCADVAALVEPAREAAEALAAELGDVDALVFAGRGAAHGIALEASLKIAEMAGIPTAAFPTEELLHGRLHGLTPRSVAFVLAETADEAAEADQVAAAMARRGCRVVVTDVGGRGWPGFALGPAPWSAIGLVVPFQWLAVRLAEARGRVPEAMRHGALSAELAIKTDARP